MHRMAHFGTLGCSYLCLLLRTVLTGTSRAQQTPDFSGDWVVKIGKRTFLELSVTSPLQSGASFGGTLVRLQHLTITGGGGFSSISGPLLRYSIVRSTIK